MDIAAEVVADLSLLSDAVRDPASTSTVVATVLGLVTSARAAVDCLLGMTVVLGADAERVTLRFTLLDPGADPAGVASSLRLPRPTDGASGGGPVVTVVLYAATPGAFVDLAADLAFLGGSWLDAAELDRHRDLAREPDVTGWVLEDATVNEAVGVLLDRGRTREQARAELDTLADAAGTSRTVEATRILGTVCR